MFPEALLYLRCPQHHTVQLELQPGADIDREGAYVSGALCCPTCATRFAIVDGVVDMLGPWAVPRDLAQVVNYLPPTAWAYERTWRSRALTILSGEPFGYDRELSLIAGLAAPQRGGLYLDVACSNGLYARAICQAMGHAPGHVVGIDHAMPMLHQARAYARQQGLRISYVRAQAQALPFAPEAAAAVMMGGSLNEIGDAATCLREIRRVLAPSGRFVLMNLVRATSLPGRALQQILRFGGLTFWSLETLNRHLTDSGLDLKSQWCYRVVVFSLLVARPFPDRAVSQFG